MNRMIRPSESLISLRTALRRSSNSPRYLAPAMSAPRSSEMTRLVLQRLRHVAADDALGQPLHDGRLAHARLADEHGVVLGAARQDLDDAADLLVAADDRVQLAGSGLGGEVAAVLLEGLVRGLGVLAGHALAAAYARRGPAGSLPCRPRCARAVAAPRRRSRRWPAADARWRRTRRGAASPRPTARSMTRRRRGSADSEPPWIRARLPRAAATSPRNAGTSTPSRAQRLGRHAVVGLHERGEEMLGIEHGALQLLGEPLRVDDRFLGLLRESIEVHRSLTPEGFPARPAASLGLAGCPRA